MKVKFLGKQASNAFVLPIEFRANIVVKLEKHKTGYILSKNGKKLFLADGPFFRKYLK